MTLGTVQACFNVDYVKSCTNFFSQPFCSVCSGSFASELNLSLPFIHDKHYSDVEYTISCLNPKLSNSTQTLDNLVKLCYTSCTPFSFVAYTKDNMVYFGVDKWSSSPLLAFHSSTEFLLATYIPSFLRCSHTFCKEVPPGVFKLDLSTGSISSPFPPPCLPPPPLTFLINDIGDTIPAPSFSITSLVTAIDHILTPLPFQEVHVSFSGGLDSTLIAFAAAQWSLQQKRKRSINLYNVSFDDEAVDRHNAITSYNQLKSLFPKVVFTLTSPDFSVDDVMSLRESAMYACLPKTTVMDINISTSLLAGFSSVSDPHVPNPIVLMGQSADELFVGYHRFQSVFKNHGDAALASSVNNARHSLISGLCRDVRTASSASISLGFPFLYHEVVALAMAVPHRFHIQDNGDGFKDKVLLRREAKKLGLDCAGFSKKAIQFGSRSAKYFGNSKKGTDVVSV
ncbi:hypothetical protein GEMRC1_000066 [Eukaryota sp. GEM-RC1]